eukprot:3005443-Amphidinium_carterae.1
MVTRLTAMAKAAITFLWSMSVIEGVKAYTGHQALRTECPHHSFWSSCPTFRSKDTLVCAQVPWHTR